jgi:PAS domain-containing protein
VGQTVPVTVAHLVDCPQILESLITGMRGCKVVLLKAFRLAPVPTTISTADDHRLVEVNDTFTRVLGYQAQDLVGYPADDIGLWADDRDRRRFEAELTKANTVRDFEA